MSAVTILKSLEEQIENTNLSTAKLVTNIISANRVFIAGVGRSGLIGKMFAIRLMHIGTSVYTVGDITTPKIQKGDLLIAITGSGSTSTVVSNVKVAKANRAKVLALTAKEESVVAQYADEVMTFSSKAKYDITIAEDNILPLGTAFELSVLLTLEASVADLISTLGIDENFLRDRHTNLE